MGELLARLAEFIAIVALVRFVIHNLLGGGARQAASSPGHFSASSGSPQPTVINGEMKKDPQCGTYVSTELSVQARYHGEVLHFCSRECQEEFFRAQAGKPA